VATHVHKSITHTLNVRLVRRLTRIAYHEELSRSSIIEHAVKSLFGLHPTDKTLADEVRAAGGVKRRR